MATATSSAAVSGAAESGAAQQAAAQQAAAPEDAIIRVEALSKVYVSRERRGLWRSRVREVTALRDVTLAIGRGELFGLLGPNGAGKTTLIKCLTTLLLPTSGTAWVNGHEIGRAENEVRASIGCMLMGERGLYWKLTGRENLDFFGALYHIPPPARRRKVDELIALLGLGELIDRTVETYSSGQKMKLAFAKALLNEAPILILDEPTNTLDVPSARELRAIVQQLNAQGYTVVYTTHQMSEAEMLCDRVAIIDRGRLLALGTVAELKAGLRQDGVLKVQGVISPAALAAVEALPGVRRAAVEPLDGGLELTVVSPDLRALLPRLIERLIEHGAVVEHILPEEPTLEDVFIALTGRSLAEDTREQP
jgi:ABC-2 type transport system ATP-binding protein